MSDYIQDMFDRAAQFPLMDAAFCIWIWRYTFDRADAPPLPRSNPPPNMGDPAIAEREFRRLYARVIFERDNAHHGVTFERLKRTHPEASDADLQNAIKAAIKLYKDCCRYFAYSTAGLFEDATRAVELARHENPGFRDSTYALAKGDVMQAMR